MNSTLVFVLMLVAIVSFANVMTTWIKQKKKEPEVDEELSDTLAKIDVLEARIQVLERINTDNRFDLKQQIDSL